MIKTRLVHARLVSGGHAGLCVWQYAPPCLVKLAGMPALLVHKSMVIG